MTPHLQRGLLLQEQGRHSMAVDEFRQHLALQPGDGFVHAALALSLAELERRDEAESAAREAIGMAPDAGFAHYALARVLSDRRRFDEASRAIEEAIRLDPQDADYHGMASAIAVHREQWQAALDAAERGLAISPEHVGCNNLRAIALVKLGRKAEAGQTIAAALSRNPDDALTHANQGWTMLERGDRKKAMEHFKESLRLDPTDDWAKAGLVEAIKAGNPLYAVVLRYFLWMQKLSPQARWGIVLGGYFGYKIIGGISKTNPQLAPFILPLQILYIAFVLLSWLAAPIFNLMLFLHPYGKHALDGDQRWQARLTGSCIAVALGFLGWWLARGMGGLEFLGAAVFGLLSLPVSAIFNCQRGWPRWAMAGISGVLLVVGSLGLVTVLATSPDTVSVEKSPGSALLGLFLIGSVASQFAANALMSVQPRR